VKRVFLEGRASGWSLHSLYQEFLCHPPEGYTFVTNSEKGTIDLKENPIHIYDQKLMEHDFLKRFSDYFRPWAYFAYYQMKSRPLFADLTYSCGHLVFRKEPWVVDLEHVGSLLGYGFSFGLSKFFIENLLSSENCKYILPWTNTGKQTLLLNLNCKKFYDKIEVVNLAVHPKVFVKKFNKEKIKLLFVGTMSGITGSFFHKGGLLVFEAFKILSARYHNLELTIRSSVPNDIKAECRKYPNIKIIEQRVPWSFIEQEFQTADIFLHPGYFTPGMAMIDAMSYELPVITTDVWANPEIVEDGVTGILIPQSIFVPYYAKHYLPKEATQDVMKAISRADPRLVKDLAEQTMVLIEDEKLRRKMGYNAREEIRIGRFSLKTRNEKLKKIFDQAT
jgi:glycosyltransferase involved in cell wall biosynthesis